MCYSTGAQSLAIGSSGGTDIILSNVAFNSGEFNIDSTQITVTEGGLYFVQLSCGLTGSSATLSYRLKINGTLVNINQPITASVNTIYSMFEFIVLNSGDTLIFNVSSSSLRTGYYSGTYKYCPSLVLACVGEL